MMNQLPTRLLGRTGLSITVLGIGAWAMGGNAWGPQDDDQSTAAIIHAVEKGINWIDTAAVYGNGHSEVVVGRAVRRLPRADRPLVFTKGGIVRDADGQNPRRVAEKNHLRLEVEASLRRLQVEAIDLYQIHWPADDVPLEDYWGTMLQLKAEGKVLHVGLSNHDIPALERAEALGHVETLQPPFSMIRRETAAELLPWCQAHETGVICYSPMQAGLLTGSFSLDRARALPEDDWRKANPEFNGEKLQRNLALVDALRPIAVKHGTAIASVVLAWTLCWKGVTGAIVGARSPDQVDTWIGAGSVVLDSDDLQAIGTAISRTEAGEGPTNPRPQSYSS